MLTASNMRFVFLILCLLPLYGQAQLDSAMVEGTPYDRILKFSPFSLIDPIPSIQFAYEWQFKDRMSFQHEAGYITEILEQKNLRNVRGLRLRNEFRYYIDQLGEGLEGTYFAPEFLFIHMRNVRNASFGMDCTDIYDCNYYQYLDYTVQKQVYALHLKAGYQEQFLNRFVYDIYAGLGFRHVWVKETDKPDSFSWDDSDWFEFRKREGNYNLPSVSLGFKIGYVLFYKEQHYLLKYNY